MHVNRRKFINRMAAAAVLAGTASSPVLAATATRRFITYLGRRQVGETSTILTRRGSRVIAETEARLHVSILGLINFDYHLTSREVWRNGVLMEIQATTNNDGRAEFVNAQRIDSGLQIDSSRFQGVVPGNPATTSYFTEDFMSRPVWISTQDGNPLSLIVENKGASTFETSEGVLNCTKYTTRGKLKINLFYDQNHEWIGSSFRVATRNAAIRMSSRGASLSQIWAG